MIDDVRVIGIPKRSSGNRLLRMTLDTWKVARMAWLQQADLYEFHDPELIPAGLVFRMMGRKVIYDAHENYRDDILSKHYLPVKTRRFVSRAIGILEDFSVRRFSSVFTATPKIAQTLSSDHTYCLSNYPMLEEFVDSDTATPRDEEMIAYVGGITIIRGIREMIEATRLVARDRPVGLTICGAIPGELSSELVGTDGWSYVEARGKQPRSVVQQVLSTAACGLCVFHPEPNHIEALPNKLFEYMAAGLPVVASDFPYWKQFVEETGAGVMVDPMNPKAIAQGIQEILAHPDRAQAMGEAGRKAVRERFNWDSEAARLINVVDHLIGLADRDG